MGNYKGLSYYLTNLVIRAKGVKRIFQTTPIPYQKLRRDDVKKPKSRFLKKHTSRTFAIKNSQITEIETSSFSDYLILFLHGGAFVSGPTIFHWNAIEQIVKMTKVTVWMCDYPKAPENDWTTLQDNIQSVYNEALNKFKPERIILLGDSAGGTLALNLTQRMQVSHPNLLPKALFLVSPVVDLTLSNPDILAVEKKDPMLGLEGVKHAKQLLQSPYTLDDPIVSPLFGRLTNLPDSYWYVAEYDITYPDQKLMLERLTRENIPHYVYFGEEMPHIWPYLPFMKQSKWALNDLIQNIKSIID